METFGGKRALGSGRDPGGFWGWQLPVSGLGYWFHRYSLYDDVLKCTFMFCTLLLCDIFHNKKNYKAKRLPGMATLSQPRVWDLPDPLLTWASHLVDSLWPTRLQAANL